jgi:cell division septation protein DedD
MSAGAIASEPEETAMTTATAPRRAAAAPILLLLCLLLPALGCGEKEPESTGERSLRLTPADAVADSAAVADSSAVGPAAAEAPAEAAAAQPAETLKRSDTPAAAAPEVDTAGSNSNPFTRTAAAPAAGGPYSLQLGSFAKQDNARKQAERLRGLGYKPAVEVAVLGGQTYHRVFLRGLADQDSARQLGEKIRAETGISYLVRRTD